MIVRLCCIYAYLSIGNIWHFAASILFSIPNRYTKVAARPGEVRFRKKRVGNWLGRSAAPSKEDKPESGTSANHVWRGSRLSLILLTLEEVPQNKLSALSML